MKRFLCLLAVCACMLPNLGCSGNAAPAKPESFAPLPGAAPGASDADAGGKKKVDNKAAAPVENAS